MDTESRLIIRYLETHPMDAARSLERLPLEEIRAVLDTVPHDAAVGPLAALPPTVAARCLSAMPASSAAGLPAGMSDQVAAGLLRRLEAAPRSALLSELPARRSERLQRQLRYDENAVGALMEMEHLQLFRDSTVKDARQVAQEHGASGMAYIVSRDQQLTGVATLRDLVTSPPDATVASLQRPPCATLSPKTDCSVALAHSCWLEVDELPIVSRDGVLLGVLRHRVLRAWAGGARPLTRGGLNTALELGELVWLGFQGLMDTVVSATAREVGHE